MSETTPPAGSVEKVPPLILRIVTDPGFIASVVTGVGIFFAVRSAAADLPPHERVELYKSAMYAFFGIVSTATAAAGYKVGKLYEGATPVGFVPTTATPAVTAIQVGEPIATATLRPLGSAGAERVSPEVFGRPTRPGFILPKLLAIVATIVVVATFCGGCVSTSEPFKRSAGAGVNNIVEDMHAYTSSHKWDANGDGTIDAAEAASRQSEQLKTDALALSVKDQKSVTLTGVAQAWRPVQPIWSAYVEHDPQLSDPADKKIRLDTGKNIDELIAAEADRQNALRSKLFLPPVDVGK